MPRRCTVCTHPRASEINALLLGDTSIRDVAGRFGLSRTATGNHAAAHLRQCVAGAGQPAPAEASSLAALVRQRGMPQPAEAETFRQHVLRDVERLEAVIEAAIASGNVGHMLAAMRTKALILSRAGFAADPNSRLSGEPERPPHDEGLTLLRRLTYDLLASDAAEDEMEEAEEPSAPMARHRARPTPAAGNPPAA